MIVWRLLLAIQKDNSQLDNKLPKFNITTQYKAMEDLHFGNPTIHSPYINNRWREEFNATKRNNNESQQHERDEGEGGDDENDNGAESTKLTMPIIRGN